MGGDIIFAVVLWILTIVFTGTSFRSFDNGEDLAVFGIFISGMLLIGAIWQSWVLYKFYILPLGL